MKVKFEATFVTDDDYTFNNEKILSTFNPRGFRQSNITYKYDDSVQSRIYIYLEASSISSQCRFACREFIEALMCSIETHKCSLMNEILSLLTRLRDIVLTRDILNHSVRKIMSGNYDGTTIDLTVYEDADENTNSSDDDITYGSMTDMIDEEHIADIVKKARHHILNKSTFDFKQEDMPTINKILCECYKLGLLRKYEEKDDGCYIEMFCVKDSIPYSAKVINFKDMYSSLTSGLMDAIEKMIEDDE